MGAISKKRKIYLDLIEDSVDSPAYRNFLDTKALPTIRCAHPIGFAFQQDNVPVHRAEETKAILREKRVRVLDWSPQSPDLNPVEQVWEWILKETHLKTFTNIQEMTAFVFEMWKKLPKNTILSFIEKLKTKCYIF